MAIDSKRGGFLSLVDEVDNLDVGAVVVDFTRQGGDGRGTAECPAKQGEARLELRIIPPVRPRIARLKSQVCQASGRLPRLPRGES